MCIHGSDLTLTNFRHPELLAGFLAEFHSLYSLGTDRKENTFAHQRVLGTDPKEKATPLLCHCPTPKKTPLLHSNMHTNTSRYILSHLYIYRKKKIDMMRRIRVSLGSWMIDTWEDIYIYISCSLLTWQVICL
jgi:hypothetical protein